MHVLVPDRGLRPQSSRDCLFQMARLPIPDAGDPKATHRESNIGHGGLSRCYLLRRNHPAGAELHERMPDRSGWFSGPAGDYTTGGRTIRQAPVD